ncbi:MAG TPA: hypothetical protein VNZ64_25060 [Candidatus Acidoferrum sp.]|jgi:hypothetical protein|nr:hypothetical protein [Candidatus Acidoferrum sp.]
MKLPLQAGFDLCTCSALLLGSGLIGQSAPVALNTNLQIRLVLNTTNSSGAASVRLAKDTRNNELYYLKLNGDIYRVNVQPGAASTSARVYSAADHGLANNVEGMAIGPDGAIYVVGNDDTNNTATFARISKGVPSASGVRTWSLLARTVPYARTGLGIFDHLFNAAVVSSDGQFLFVNSGARTDHGEVESAGGLYPNLRDVPLTTKIFRLPTSGSNLVLTNDLNALRQAGYVFAEGVRNAFDLAFGPDGELFATDNGPDRDMPDSLYWVRPGLHFGFPWHMGGADNPQQLSSYDPSTDKLLDPRYYAVAHGLYQNDPTFPPPPTNFTAPVINLGPDADRFRDPVDGSIKSASSLGQTLSTFTAHRSPLGLVFDTLGALAPPFRNHGFMLSWTPGDPVGDSLAGPFDDPSQDLVDLNLTKLGNTNYQATVTRIVGGFANPVDSEIIGNRLYAIENGGDQGLWEIVFPPSLATIILSAPSLQANGAFSFNVTGTPGLTYEIDASSNLVNWVAVTNLIPSGSQFQFTDPNAIGSARKFFRVVQH